tara:strand:+ start:1283 stop:1624 length:342 start_codon:yes stop_codon:yes gene_type:complete
VSIENDTVTGGEYPSWDNHTAKLFRDAKASAELFTPPLYKWMEYADDDRNPLGVTDGKVLNLTEPDPGGVEEIGFGIPMEYQDDTPSFETQPKLNPEGLKNLKERTQSNGYYV